MRILVLISFLLGILACGCDDDKTAPANGQRVILLLSGLGQENTPHPGMVTLSEKLKLQYPDNTVMVAAYSDFLNSDLKPELVICHSFGSEKAFTYKARLTVMIDPVRYGWKKDVMDFGDNAVFKVTRRNLNPFPPVANIKSTKLTDISITGNHNSVMTSSLTHDKVMAWIKEQGLE